VGRKPKEMSIRRVKTEEADEICSRDPVRPDIPMGWRVQPPDKEVYVLEDKPLENRDSIGIPEAVLCLAKSEIIPITEDELLTMNSGNFVVCYSVWSNRKGAGREIIFDVLNHLGVPELNGYRYITMSPKTDMAYNFHIRNGAKLLQENELTYNFEYVL